MQIALYCQPGGYYADRAPQRCGDYWTAPSLTPAFGALVARQLALMWKALDRPDPFYVTEPGAGMADLAAVVANAAPPDLVRCLVWRFVEPMAEIAEVQKRRMSDGGWKAQWHSSLNDMDPVEGVILANEVLDNMPFRIFQKDAADINEVLIGLSGDHLVEVLGPPPDAATFEPMAPLLEQLAPQDRFELRHGLSQWCLDASLTLQRGFVLIADYGDTEPGIYLDRPAGSVVTYRDGALGFDPLEAPGLQDITAHVNFSALQRDLTQAGFTCLSLESQRDWLTRLGIKDVLDENRSQRLAAEAAGDHPRTLQLIAEGTRIQSLRAPGGLGELLVLVATKGSVPLPLLAVPN